MEEIDAAIKEVNELLGEVEPSSASVAAAVAMVEKASCEAAAAATKSLLSVERRSVRAWQE